ncbi:hypothetical protein F5B19DRAFT_470120 [Rostrohypoxylon terebratum]|nr:hypothetical protein F5B19DRAFT_470120 [Rostrohypoxylon terebratum]
MAFPPQALDDEFHPEDFTNDNEEALAENFSHNDMHENNMLFGDFEEDGSEHSVLPILKIIDFERFGAPYRWGHPGELGHTYNILECGRALRRLIWTLGELKDEVFWTNPGGVQGGGFTTTANFPPDHYTNLDPQLRRLVIEMCAENWLNRPTLADLKSRVLEGVAREPEFYADYPRDGEIYESDEFIRAICQRYILEAPHLASDDTSSDEEGQAQQQAPAGQEAAGKAPEQAPQQPEMPAEEGQLVQVSEGQQATAQAPASLQSGIQTLSIGPD